MKKSSERTNSIERALRILEYLKKNTDSGHTLTLRALFNAPALAECMCGKAETLFDNIEKMRAALNNDEDGHPKPIEQYRIIVDKDGGDNDFEEYDGENNDEKERKTFKGLYYNHAFNFGETDDLIESVLFSRVLDENAKHSLIKKIEDNLTSKYYKTEAKNIRTVREIMPSNREALKENLRVIGHAAKAGVKISFVFNRYNKSNKLEPDGRGVRKVSPYYIAAYNGRYYLIAGSKKDENSEAGMTIWRVDLMTQLKEEKEPAEEKKNVRGLPPEWSDDFMLLHLNMSFDDPKWIKLKITAPTYTFLNDWFGSFQYVGEDEDGGSIVRVRCSPYGMANWALQYSDRVEVLEPLEVRKMVAEKLRALNKKYGI